MEKIREASRGLINPWYYTTEGRFSNDLDFICESLKTGDKVEIFSAPVGWIPEDEDDWPGEPVKTVKI